MSEFFYINGKLLEEGQAKISVRDRGFKLGDGVFDTLRVYNGVIYQWDIHLERLKNGLKTLEINADISNLHKHCLQLIEKNNSEDGMIRITISRGIGGEGYLPDNKSTPTIVIETRKNPEFDPTIKLWQSSVVKTSPFSIPTNIKTLQGLNSIIARMEAQKNGCSEALLFNEKSNICECSSSSIFWFKGDVLNTPSLESGILPGTIRDAVIRLSPFKINESIFNLNDMEQADEVFLTSVSLQVTPVSEILPSGKSWSKYGKTTQIHQLLKKDIEDYVTAKKTALE